MLIRAIERPISILLLSIGAYFFLLCLVITAVMTLDAYARYSDYKRFTHVDGSSQVYNYFRSSWCSRGVAEALWSSATRIFYKNKGYRWWHILPDGAPRIFFDLDFWKAVLIAHRPRKARFAKYTKSVY